MPKISTGYLSPDKIDAAILGRVIPFVVVAEELSFVRAAKRLMVDRAWLSRQISQLEQQLGFPVFYRNTRNVQLSPEGEALLPHAREIVNNVVRAGDVARQLNRQHETTFRFGVMPFTYWIPERNCIIERFQEKLPYVRLNILPRSPDTLLDDTLNGVVDAGILIDCGDIPLQLQSHVVHKSQPGVLLPADDELAAQPIIRHSDLRGRRVAVTDPALWPSRDPIYELLERVEAIPVVVPEGQPAIKFYARRERLILVTFSWPWGELMNDDHFVYKELSPPLDVIEYVVVRRPDNASSAGEVFWELVTSIDPDRLDSSSEVASVLA